MKHFELYECPELGQISTAGLPINIILVMQRGFQTFNVAFQRKNVTIVYDNFSRNLNKCWAQLEAKVTPTSDDLLTSNLFYSRITIVRNMKFEFEGILIIISILF